MTQPAPPPRTQAEVRAWLEALLPPDEVVGVMRELDAAYSLLLAAPALARAVLGLLNNKEIRHHLYCAPGCKMRPALDEALRILSDAMGERGG